VQQATTIGNMIYNQVVIMLICKHINILTYISS